jgi:hypothetical protein
MQDNAGWLQSGTPLDARSAQAAPPERRDQRPVLAASFAVRVEDRPAIS